MKETEDDSTPISLPLKMKFKAAKTVVTGPSHLQTDPPTPCQDHADSRLLANGLVASVVCDGAGSSRHSELASRFCVERILAALEEIDFIDFMCPRPDPENLQHQWSLRARQAFQMTRQQLEDFAVAKCIELADLYCTLLVIVQVPWGFMVAHVGDGRAGYYDGQAQSLMVPLATYTAGQTVFLLNRKWEDAFRSSIVFHPAPDLISYYFLCSDGPQTYLMERSSLDPKADRVYESLLGDEAYYDTNLPYHPFFQGLIQSLNEVGSEEERNNRLKQLIELGKYELSEQVSYLSTLVSPELDDDKSLVFFYRE